MEHQITNMEKYENYREQMGRLNRAIKSKFYLEAIFISYALIEDRTESILRHAGKFNEKKNDNDNFISLDKKLRRIEELCRAKKGIAQQCFGADPVKEIRTWKKTRNDLIHKLLKQKVTTDELEQVALDGQRLAKELSNKGRTYKRRLEKLNPSPEK